MKKLRSREQVFDLKNRDMPEQDKWLTKRVFKTFLTHHTKSCNKQTSHKKNPSN